MKKEKDYIGDIAAIRNMMERSSKFLSLAGWAGIMAGVYGLAGAWVVYTYLGFNPQHLSDTTPAAGDALNRSLLLVAVVVLVLALGTAVLLSARKATKRQERIWNSTAKRMLIEMAAPLVVGGLFTLVLMANGLTGLLASALLIFYGLSLFNAGKFTYVEIRVLGVLEMILGLIAACYPNYGLICWSFGFGILHILTGIYLHYKYER